VVAGAAAGGAVYYMSQVKQSPTPATVPAPAAIPPAAPAPAAATPAAAPQPATPATESAPENANLSSQDVASVEFTKLEQPFSLVRDSAAYVSASGDAPQMYPLRAGTAFTAAEKSSDGKWVIGLTEDGQAAYLQAADLGPYDPSRQPKPEQPAMVSGAAVVVDTATLTINGQTINLSGVKGETGNYATQLQQLITAQGPAVNCEQQSDGYLCKLPSGIDIARAALYNGAAEPSDSASDDYRAQADAAKAARRGIWQ